MGTPTTSRDRVPVGSLIAIAPPAGGASTTLRDIVTTAGLTAGRALSRDDVRVKFGNQCHALGCRAVPASCRHHEEQVDALVETYATTFLAGAQTWLYDPTELDPLVLVDHVQRAHRAGLAAVALRRRGEAGAEHMTLEAAMAANATMSRRTPTARLAAIWEQYRQLTTNALYALGFDVVIDWDEDTQLDLLPEGPDGRGIDTSKFAVVGDLHGCAQTFLERMLPALGTDRYLSNPDVVVVSVGDIHDKGADPQGSVDLIRWWLWALRTGRALMVDSNHNRKLVRHLSGHPVRISPGLADTLVAIDAQPDADALKEDIVTTFSRLPSHLWFDDLVIAHAGVTEDLLGNNSNRARQFTLYVRQERTDWHWTGTQTLVHGHDPVRAPAHRQAEPDQTRPDHLPGPVINVDTGAYAGGTMSAYVHSTGATVSVETFPHEAVTPKRRDDELAALQVATA